MDCACVFDCFWVGGWMVCTVQYLICSFFFRLAGDSLW